MNCKLTSQDAEFIRVFHEFEISSSKLAKEYGVHVDTIRNIVNGKSFQGNPLRSKQRKLTDDQARQVREWAAAGLGEVKIAKNLGGIIGRSTVRQIINNESYQDVT